MYIFYQTLTLTFVYAVAINKHATTLRTNGNRIANESYFTSIKTSISGVISDKSVCRSRNHFLVLVVKVLAGSRLWRTAVMADGATVTRQAGVVVAANDPLKRRTCNVTMAMFDAVLFFLCLTLSTYTLHYIMITAAVLILPIIIYSVYDLIDKYILISIWITCLNLVL